MLIDWFTVIAQIVNFVILLGLLKWLLFDRIVRAMDERQETIVARLNAAEEKQRAADERAERVARQRRQIDQRREEMLESARRNADQQRRQWQREAREEVDQLRQRWQHDLRRQQRQLVAAFSEQAADALLQTMRQALRELAGADLQQQTVQRFLQTLATLEEDTRRHLVEGMASDGAAVVVRSAAELSGESRDQIRQGLQKHLRDGISPSYEQSPELICGLELQAGQRAIGWNLGDYLSRFRETLEQALDEQTQAAESSSE
jgi:F-type H+-transporting ATPase subunit b